MIPDDKIIVAGGGLTVAAALERAGKEVLVLEARLLAAGIAQGKRCLGLVA